uniref:Uncharacterized protein n=1 Tax=Manihot esculenta TaxID=3983 RepID=A0A2C9V2R7_MANES
MSLLHDFQKGKNKNSALEVICSSLQELFLFPQWPGYR